MSKTPDLTAQFAELTQQVTDAFGGTDSSAALSESAKLFETFGRWMQVNGSSIYGATQAPPARIRSGCPSAC